MLANTVRTRGVTFAFIIGPPRFVAREEASRVHNAVCDATGLDDLAFRYSPIDAPQRRGPGGFQIVIGRQEGRGGFQIIVELNPTTQIPGLKLLISYEWPPSLQHVTELATQTIDSALNAMDGDWQKALAEVRLKAECSVRGDDAVAYIRDELCNLRPGALEGLGDPLTFCSFALEISETRHGDNPLSNAKREVRIEVLRDNPRLAYIETVSQWSQTPPAVRMQLPALDSLRPFDQSPADYINDAYTFLTDKVLVLGKAPGD